MMQTLRKLLSFAVVFALVAGAVVFAIGNQTPVPVYYLLGRADEQPLWQVAGLSFLFGAVVAWIVSLWLISRAKLAERRHRKHAERLEAEVHKLRNLPLAPAADVPTVAAAASPTSATNPPPSPPSGGG